MVKIFDRPFAVCCFSFIIAACVGYFCSQYVIYALLGAAALLLLSVACIIICSFKGAKRYTRNLFVCFFALLFFLSALAISHCHFTVSRYSIAEFYNQEVDVIATCKEVKKRTSYSAVYVVSVEEINSSEHRFLMLLRTQGEKLERGERFGARLTLCPFEDNVGGYSERSVYESEGIVANLIQGESEIDHLGESRGSFSDVFKTINEKVTDRFSMYLSDRGASFFSGVFAGDNSYITDYDMLSLRRSGTSHLLAVSGMHFSVLMGMFLVIFSVLGIPVRPRYLLLMLIALSYAAFTGFSPSVVRSGIMLFVTYFGHALGKNRDSVTSLLFAMALMIAFRPYYILSTSFWLSCSASFGIVLLSPFVSEIILHRHRSMLTDVLRDDTYTVPLRIVLFVVKAVKEFLLSIPYALVSLITVGVAAAVFSLSFSLLFFGSVSYTAIPCGMLLSPIVSLAMVTAPFVLVFCGIPVVALFASCLGELFFTITQYFSHLNGVYLNVDYTAVTYVVLAFVVAVIICLCASNSKKPLAVASALFLIGVFVCAEISESYESREPCAVYCATDSIALRGDNGLVVVDMGSDSITDISKVLSSVASLKENETSSYVFCHLSSKHEMLVRFLASNSNVSTLYFPDYASVHMRILAAAGERAAREYGVEVEYFRYSEKFYTDGVRVNVGALEYLERSKRPVYSVSVDRCGGSILWLSSAYFEGEKDRGELDRYYDLVILGSLGPKPKEEYGDPLLDIENSLYIVGSDELLEWLGKNVRESVSASAVKQEEDGVWKFKMRYADHTKIIK